MVWQNTKLLARLYYRPVAATSDIIDEASWIYAAVLVIAISFVLNAVVFSHIYSGYEAVARPMDEQEIAGQQAIRRSQLAAIHASGRVPPGMNEEELVNNIPRVTFEQRPLPIVKQYGWWFVSFAPTTFLTSLLGMAFLKRLKSYSVSGGKLILRW